MLWIRISGKNCFRINIFLQSRKGILIVDWMTSLCLYRVPPILHCTYLENDYHSFTYFVCCIANYIYCVKHPKIYLCDDNDLLLYVISFVCRVLKFSFPYITLCLVLSQFLLFNCYWYHFFVIFIDYFSCMT